MLLGCPVGPCVVGQATKASLSDQMAKTGKSGAKLMKFKMFFGFGGSAEDKKKKKEAEKKAKAAKAKAAKEKAAAKKKTAAKKGKATSTKEALLPAGPVRADACSHQTCPLLC